MTGSDQSEIMSRLQKLEKQNKYMKLVGLAIVLLFVMTLFTGEIAEEIRVERIVVVDEQGKEKIVMENINSFPQIVMFDTKEKLRLGLYANDLGPSLTMCDSKGKSRLDLLVNETSRTLSICDPDGRIRLSLMDSENNGGRMDISNKTNEMVVELGADEYGNGVVGVYNRKGQERTLKPVP